MSNEMKENKLRWRKKCHWEKRKIIIIIRKKKESGENVWYTYTRAISSLDWNLGDTRISNFGLFRFFSSHKRDRFI